MSRFDLFRFDKTEELADAVAKRWVADLAKVNPAYPYFVALAGGRITRPFYASVVWECRTRSVSLDFIHFFWGDERCVPPNHPESTFGAARNDLLVPLGIGEERIHRIFGELPRETALAAALADVQKAVPMNPDGQPVFDLVFLGMGEDGHVASLFPGEPDGVVSSKAIYRGVIAVKPPPPRITLGYAAIVAARQVWVLVSGPRKAASLRESLSPTGQTPLARVIRMREKTLIFTDVKTS